MTNSSTRDILLLMDLTDRQRELLKAVIELYVKSGEPIGSESVEKNYDLGISPATIRHEMGHLTDLGFLKQPHTSAGRIPTSMGFRLYINALMKEKEVSVIDEVSIKQKLMDRRQVYEDMVREATRSLAQKCNMLALSVLNDSDQFYYSGAANILDLPEFYDIDVTRFVLSLFDQFPTLQQILGRAQGSDPIHVIFGDETEFEYLRPTGFAFTRFDSGMHSGVVGVIGPARMNYPTVFPYLRYVGKILSEYGRLY